MDNKKEKTKWELDYVKKKEELIKFLELKDNSIMVLATSHNNKVLARNVLIANNELEIYFFTWGHSRKAVQIQMNPRVALCKDRVQIEGIAEILGNLTNDNNRKYTDILRKKFPESIALWENFPGMIIVRISPTFIVLGGDVGEEPYLEFLDLEKETAYAERWAYY